MDDAGTGSAVDDETLVGDGVVPRSAASFDRGGLVGRYVVLSQLGQGGMGVVYSAYDPELDRKVALKLLHPDAVGSGSDGAGRMLREAQALAKLSHPNVVAVHDVGARDGEVWLAMEFVAGRTLGAWSKETRRSWREVLAVLRPIALGLAAAHDAGLVHRDVKPENVMLGDDGRVRVMDFGLARGAKESIVDPSIADEGDVDAVRTSAGHLEFTLTRDGRIPGTPAYMSPEQAAGTSTDARSDQFSFSVMLWEALYGERPFAGGSPIELATNVLEGKRRAPPRGARVPRWLRAVVERGLAVDPSSRWPSMSALLEALERGRRRTTVRRVAVVLGVVGLVGVGVLGARYVEEHRRIAACEDAGAAIDAVWSHETRERVRAGLLASGVAYAATTADDVMPWLDDQASAWRSARVEGCLDAHVRGTWTADLLDRSTWCLDDRKRELEALVTELARGDAGAVSNAVTAAASLRTVDSCRDAALLERLPAPPAGSREDLEAVRAELSRARALEATAAYELGLEVAEHGLSRAQELGWPPLVAEAERWVGKLLMRRSRYDDAEERLQSAYFDAARAGAIEVAEAAATDLVSVVGVHLARVADGLRWSKHADVMLSTLPDRGGLRRAQSLNRRATVQFVAGAYDEAAELYAQVVEIRARALGPDHPELARSIVNLANAQSSKGAYAEAAEQYRRALPIIEKAMGPEHPDVAKVLDNLCVVTFQMGDPAEAETLCAQGLEIREEALGPDHPAVAKSSSNLANVQHSRGEYDRAEASYRRALRILERKLGPDHPAVASVLANLAGVYSVEGDHAEALKLDRRALAIREGALGANHPLVARTLEDLAVLHEAMGETDQAAKLWTRELSIWEAASGPDDPVVAYPLVGLAGIALAQGRATDAVDLAERAVRVREAQELRPGELADARFVLARALVAAGELGPRPVTLAEQARDEYREIGDARRDDLEETEAWLRSHGR